MYLQDWFQIYLVNFLHKSVIMNSIYSFAILKIIIS
ncbi:Uncharacterised protein [Orientia tsutsugamushi str. Gilliam]|uniref:Uncharacterized protein n=1 Tax=Orientia tsutsugamushi str. Gilliam TaxID=1359184 RepID=A0A2U3QU15_ORITS|nr:Uncharacterised protein [Orientia tsutsugamushi str. Gilliam]